MNITNLDTMEQIVSAHDNLSWDGWTVVERSPVRNGMFSTNTVVIDGQWYKQQRFVPTRAGWKLPKRYLG